MTSKKGNDKKVGAVQATRPGSEIERTEGVGSVGSIQPTSGIMGTRGVGGVAKRRPTRVMTNEDREQLLKMVTEEAERLFGKNTNIPAERREIIEEAVKMTIEASLTEAETSPKKKR